MQKRKKQLLGLSGLAVVGIMTGVALCLPASAYDADMVTDSREEGTSTGSKGTTVRVEVRPDEKTSDVRIVSPKNGEQVTSNKVQVTVSTINIESMQLVMSYKGEDGREITQTFNDPRSSASELSAVFDVSLPLGETDYSFKAVATGTNGATLEDAITISYRAVSVVSKGETAENNDPIIHITANEAVNKLQVQVYTKDGDSKPLFVNSDGEQEALILGRDVLDENGHIALTLPFEKYKAQAGTYIVAVVAYDAEGKVISMNRVEVKYSPKAPETPSTGSMLLDTLNISRMDYLLTGLIAFGAVAGFAVYLVFRKNRR